MGRASIKENKSPYQEAREQLGLTRAKASELLECITDTRLEKIERGTYPAHPDEILVMAEKYNKPELCNYFCVNECPIGNKFVPAVKQKDLPTITLEMLNTINNLNESKERLVEITVDGQITEDELADFKQIKENLDKMSDAIESLKLWTMNAMANQNK